jgi:formylglycine-generating enzyme required for sulfatase activity
MLVALAFSVRASNIRDLHPLTTAEIANKARVKSLMTKTKPATKETMEGYLQKWGPGKVVARACEDALVVNVSQAREAPWLGRCRAEAGGGAASGGDAGIEWVTIPGRDYQMSRTEVTVAQYGACVRAGRCSKPRSKKGCTWSVSGTERHPVNCVKWKQAKTFAKWAGGRLPSEEEWEYAAKGGEEHEYSGSSSVDEVAWYSKNAGGGTQAVGRKKANGYGLYDMSGNVWEWTATPGAFDKYSGRILRGGSWDFDAAFARVVGRDSDDPRRLYNDVGFRLARSI